jgi:hypothetical protein
LAVFLNGWLHVLQQAPYISMLKLFIYALQNDRCMPAALTKEMAHLMVDDYDQRKRAPPSKK